MEVPVPNFIKRTILAIRLIPIDQFSFYFSLIGYLAITFFILILIVMAYIKIKFRFWSMQPVFHVYDFWYYLFPIGIIGYELPTENKYCNFKNIECLPYSSVSKLQKATFFQFIRRNYLQNKENQYLPNESNIIPYFEGHNSTCFFSFYYEDELLLDSKKSEFIPTKKCIGAMTTRPLHITINLGKSTDRKKGTNKQELFDCYYVDYLCIDAGHRKKGIAPQIIQTHHHHQRRLNKNILVSLFKREGDLTGIVPLCVYDTYGYYLNGWSKPIALNAQIALVECGPSNIHHLFDFMKIETRDKFDICISSEISNLLELIKTKNIFVYMLIQDGDVLSCYFFRKTCTFVKKNVECITLFASILGNKIYKISSIFVQGYMNALWKICTGTSFQFAGIERVADNRIIIDGLLMKPHVISPTAYFFYNFAHPTFLSDRVFIVC